MAKRFDITDKLNFEEKPVIIVKGKEIEVNDDAMTVLKLMDVMGDGDSSLKSLAEMANLVFTGKGKKEIDKLNLNFKDYSVVVSAAVEAIIGDDAEESGE